VSYPGLTARDLQLLKALVERYIDGGQPIGSRTLAKAIKPELSPATIRNIMADLEDLGLVRSPHTSAGRVPTVHGYRVFVDSLVTIAPLDAEAVQTIQRRLVLEQSPKELFESATAALSSITHMAGVVTLPRREQVTLRQVEFLPLSHRRVLVILVVNEEEVQNRIITTEREYTAAELEEAAHYLTARFRGRAVHEVADGLVAELKTTRERMDRLMHTLIDVAERIFEPGEEDEDYLLAGQTNLMEFSELSDLERLRQLFDAFQHKHELLQLLEQCMRGEGLQIFIGEESGYDVLGGCSVVTAPYCVEGQLIGVLGVIGPTRMDYQRVIPIVDVTAKLLGAALNQR
jgi:heat-inducible transcriptional repressor